MRWMIIYGDPESGGAGVEGSRLFAGEGSGAGLVECGDWIPSHGTDQYNAHYLPKDVYYDFQYTGE